MSKPICELAIIGHENQPFTLKIQSSNRIYVTGNIDNVTDRLTVIATFFFYSRENKSRLIEGDINRLFSCCNWLSINSYLVFNGIGLLTKFR